MSLVTGVVVCPDGATLVRWALFRMYEYEYGYNKTLYNECFGIVVILLFVMCDHFGNVKFYIYITAVE